jgi:acetyltransferase-like isoleucine patch superfamily enzyme
MIKKFWNGSHPLGIFSAAAQMISSLFNALQDKVSTFFWRFNLKKMGKKSVIQKSVTIRYPGNLVIGNNVNIGRHASICSEISKSHFFIGDNSQVNKDVSIDYTGGVTIGNNVVLSSNVKIYSHSHGYDPKSKAIAKPLIIEDDVWIGANSLILENVEYIGKGSMIAAGSIVTKSVEKNAIVGGNPAKLIRYK